MRRYFACLLLILALAMAASAQQKKSTAHSKDTASNTPQLELRPNLPSEETVNAFMQQMFGYNSALSWKVADIRPSEADGLAEVTVIISSAQGQQATKLYVTHDGQHALAGDLIPFGTHPFEAARKQLEKGINGPARGPADAPVTVVEFSDLQCPHCKAAEPVLDKLLSEETNVRFVFQNFPLPMHDWAAKAADYADCVGRSSNDAFWKFVQDTFAAQGDITQANADEKLTGIAEASGVKGKDVAACAAQPETQARVEHSVALGRALNITGTPMLFVNGRGVENIGNIPYDLLKKLVEFAAKEAQTQQAAK